MPKPASTRPAYKMLTCIYLCRTLLFFAPYADFLENKMSFDRACEIFGKDASGIIKQCLLSIQDSFVADNLVYFEKKGKTGAHTMKLGWKFELLNKLSGEKSGALKLTEEQNTIFLQELTCQKIRKIVL